MPQKNTQQKQSSALPLFKLPLGLLMTLTSLLLQQRFPSLSFPLYSSHISSSVSSWLISSYSFIQDKALRLFDVRTPTTAVRGVIFTHTISALSWKQQTDPHQLAVGTGAGVEILDCRTMTRITERVTSSCSCSLSPFPPLLFCVLSFLPFFLVFPPFLPSFVLSFFFSTHFSSLLFSQLDRRIQTHLVQLQVFLLFIKEMLNTS